MAKKKKTTKKPAKAIVKKEDRELMWAGGKDLFGKYVDERSEVKRNSIMVVATALDITPFGVNFLGGIPYVNNAGIKDKLQAYNPGAQFEYQWIRRSEDDLDKAIVECRIVKNGKPIKVNGTDMPWIVGECSPKSMKMSTLAGTQNMMAQTRSENRAFRYAFGLKMHKELMKRIGEILKKGGTDEDTAVKALSAGMVSAEEINLEPEKIKKEVPRLPMKTAASNPVQIAADAIEGALKKSTLAEMRARVKANEGFTSENKKFLLNLIDRRERKIRA